MIIWTYHVVEDIDVLHIGQNALQWSMLLQCPQITEWLQGWNKTSAVLFWHTIQRFWYFEVKKASSGDITDTKDSGLIAVFPILLLHSVETETSFVGGFPLSTCSGRLLLAASQVVLVVGVVSAFCFPSVCCSLVRSPTQFLLFNWEQMVVYHGKLHTCLALACLSKVQWRSQQLMLILIRLVFVW